MIQTLKGMRQASLTMMFLLSCAFTTVSAQRLVEIGCGYAATSVNTTIFRNSSLVTQNGIQFAAYYDADGFLTLAKRKVNESQWDLKHSKYKGNVKDAHNSISIGIDGDGFLHVSFDHHSHPLHYVRSVAPYSLELGDMIPMNGEDEKDVTYPEFYSLAGGDLLFAYRSGASGRGNLVMKRYDVKTKTWHSLNDIIISGEGKRNAYWQLCTDKEGVIHLSWVWRETPDVATNHDLCYARSKDGGKTWENSKGECYALPITAATAEYAAKIPQKSELINQTSMATSQDGRPYIATYWREQGDSVPQYRMVWLDEKGKWQQRQVMSRRTPFSLSGVGTKMIPIARPRIAVRQQSIAKSKKLKNQDEVFFIFRDAERDSRVSIAHCPDLKKGKWQVSDATPFTVDAWEPSYDLTLFQQTGQLHIFVQHSTQGDGEKTTKAEPSSVYVLEY